MKLSREIVIPDPDPNDSAQPIKLGVAYTRSLLVPAMPHEPVQLVPKEAYGNPTTDWLADAASGHHAAWTRIERKLSVRLPLQVFWEMVGGFPCKLFASSLGWAGL